MLLCKELFVFTFRYVCYTVKPKNSLCCCVTVSTPEKLCCKIRKQIFDQLYYITHKEIHKIGKMFYISELKYFPVAFFAILPKHLTDNDVHFLLMQIM
jgi:hypothetical protein